MSHYLREQPIGRQVLIERVRDARMPEARGLQELYVRLFEAHPNTLAELVAPRQCAYCYATYRECANLGQWQCRFHPGRQEVDKRVLDTWLTRSRWTCCDQIDNAQGCTACDHTETRAWSIGGARGGADGVLPAKTVVPLPDFLLSQWSAAAQLLPLGHPLRELLAHNQLAAPQQEARLRRLDRSWRVAEVRHSEDVRDAAQEQQYQAWVLGADPQCVMRTDHYRRRPLELY